MGNPTINNNGDISFGTLGSGIADSASSAWNSLTSGLKQAGGAVGTTASSFVNNLGKVTGGGGGFGFPGGFIPPQPDSPKFNSDRAAIEPPTPPAKTVAQIKNEASPKSSILEYPLNNKSKFKFGIEISDYVKFEPFEKPKLKIEANIFLPVPDNLVERYGTTISEVSLGAAGAIAAQEIGRFKQGGVENIESSLNQSLNYLYESGKDFGVKNLMTLGALQVAKGIGAMGDLGDKIQNIAEAGLGAVVNPNVAALFKGVKLREHSFKWKFYPRNQEESTQVRLIVGKLRKSMLPQVSQGIGAIFSYPKVFSLNILPDENNPYLYKFKKCFLESMEVNYSPSGPAFHKNNAPAEISLTLQFQEIVVFTADDFDEQGDFTTSGSTPAGTFDSLPSTTVAIPGGTNVPRSPTGGIAGVTGR